MKAIASRSSGMPLRITGAEFLMGRMPFRLEVAHSLKRRSENETGFLVLKSEDGAVGVGEYLARPYVTGESASDGLANVGRLVRRLAAATIDDPLNALRELAAQADDTPAALATVSSAVWCAGLRPHRLTTL